MGVFLGPFSRSLGGRKSISGAAPAPVSAFVVLTGDGGMPGFSYELRGWAGQNGVVGPGDVGSLISGQALAFLAGADIAVGDAVSGTGPLVLAPPFFSVSASGAYPVGQFSQVSLSNGKHYAVADAAFNNNGGDGPTIWGWAMKAGITFPTQYTIVLE